MKKAFLALALTVGLTTSSCLGPNNLYRSIQNWNAELSDMDWLNEIVFLGLNIIPVYGIALWVDYLIFNTINYWGGENVIDEPGAFPGFTSGD